MTYIGSKSIELQQRAMKVAPLGVNSNFRYWGEGAVGLFGDRSHNACYPCGARLYRAGSYPQI